MKNTFEEQAALRDWGFEYGRRDFQNLIEDTVQGKTYMVCDPIKRKWLKNTLGVTTSTRYKGNFMLLRQSDLDNEYSGKSTNKYETHIEPLLAELDSFEDALQGCVDDIDISFESTEIVNVFSENMDGLVVNFEIKVNV